MDAALIKFFLENWPTIIVGLMIGRTYAKLSSLAEMQNSTNKRVSKLVKNHAERHPDDAAYLYDDTRDIK